MQTFNFKSSLGLDYEVTAQKGKVEEVYSKKEDTFLKIEFNPIRNIHLATNDLGNDVDFELSFLGGQLYVVELKPVHLGAFAPSSN